VEYSGKVYCVVVPNHTLYVRRKGICHWSGNTHQEDMDILDPIIEDVVLSVPNAVLAMFCDHGYVTKYRRLMEAGKLMFMPPVPFQEYPQYLANFDVGIAPIVNSSFNRGKSNLKILETGAHGIPAVASKVAPYARFIDHGKDGFFSRDLTRVERVHDHSSNRRCSAQRHGGKSPRKGA